MSQSYNDIEVILVNDCSTDDSADICKNLQTKYRDRIVFIDKPVNEGVDKARFTGLEYVFGHNGDGAVMFVDSDDWLRPRSVELLMADMTATDADVVQMGWNRVAGPVKYPYTPHVSPRTIEQPQLFDDYFVSFFGINILEVNMCGKLYKVKTLATAALQPTGFRMGEDLLFNMKLFPLLKRYSIIDYKGYNYRVGGLTSGYNPALWDDLKRQYYIKRDFARQYDYSKAYRPLNIELKNILISSLVQRITSLKESDAQLTAWLKNELDDDALWADIRTMAKSEKQQVYSQIADKDADALIKTARAQVHASRWRRRAKKVLSLLFG